MPQNRRVMYGGKLKPTARVNKMARRIKVKTPEDLAQLDKQGLIEFLRSDRPDKVAIWNMRFGHYNAEPVDLSGAYLPGAQLAGIQLPYANLTKVTLSVAHLEGAQLKGAVLDGAFLEEAYLDNANLEEAHLIGANLSKALLRKADLTKAHLNEANLRKAYLDRADLSEAHLEGANLRTANLPGAVLIEAFLEGANFVAANLEGADFFNAYLKDTNFLTANLKKSDLSQAHLEGANLSGARFEGANLRRAILRDTELSTIFNLKKVALFQTHFGNVLSLRYVQFLEDEDDPESSSTIWEDIEHRYHEAKDVYKTLKGYFEDAGDYEGANWAYANEQKMAKLFFAPAWARGFYPLRKWEPIKEGPTQNKVFWKPNTLEWLRLEASDKFAGYGLSITKPLIWLLILIFGCSIVYLLGGMVTSMPGCGYADLAAAPRPGCAPTYRLIDNVLFSLGALTSTDVGTLRPYLSGVGLLMTVEILLGILLTGLLGFVLGNKLRNS